MQSVTEMALARAEFYQGISADAAMQLMRNWLCNGLDPKEITFWETRSSKFRAFVCDLAGEPRQYAGKRWGEMAESTRERLRDAVRELKHLVDSEFYQWEGVEEVTRQAGL